jgi:hypothetical protein
MLLFVEKAKQALCAHYAQKNHDLILLTNLAIAGANARAKQIANPTRPLVAPRHEGSGAYCLERSMLKLEITSIVNHAGKEAKHAHGEDRQAIREKIITRTIPAQIKARECIGHEASSPNPLRATTLRVGNNRKVGVHIIMQNEYMSAG